MNKEKTLILTMINHDRLLKVCLHIKEPQKTLKGDCLEYPMEPENKEQLYNLLPDFCKVGTIVEIEEIFSSVDK